ncbi:SusC/RagA family TonB-linked outer membrane protein [Pedobacter nyackensis]|uniref:TonB-linked outer membrane protein, SusC/RagA family n=1 Tax=Pedobacter nyackensis TaxID=475255 RepID=A0A1W2CT24_9SPHI|nr:SusC/RagA family TonB-linked outer membrane protein [Pedobacter nyackensis]SMC88096.1 TonB-linked outer membrane protein, SusC/RagA family [Pedobacter nyackensis]
MKKNYEELINVKNIRKGECRKIGMLTLLFLALSINVMAQLRPKVSLDVKNVQLSTALDALQKQVKTYIVYNHEEVNAKPKVTLKVKDQSLDNVLEQLLAGSGLKFSFRANSVIIGPKQKDENTGTRKVSITGEVTDENRMPLPRATVSELGTSNGVLSDENGRFRLSVAEDAVLVITYLGMTDQRISVAGKTSFKITMKLKDTTIDEVVVTGIPFNRRTESFTGSASKITREQLLKAGNLNIFQSLKSVEPSLNIQDNLAFGSDPNRMPEMQIRGASSFPDLKGQYATSPNQPLFIVDGFEMTIQKVSDLDINRVESVTILKDASAKALYGSRAGNGVIVIETVKVKAGELRINYTATVGLEMPDLNSYNLVNATEKIDLERQLGAYSRLQPIVGLQYDSLYYANLKEVQSGVNTDWLAQPVRTGITNKHTFGFEAGDDKLRAGLTFFSNNTQGVMKGSERKSLGGALSLTYRYKNVLFRNQLQYTGVKAANSPYGEFSEYARLNPYWRPFNADGSVRKLLGIGPVLSESVYNPMYNATLNTASTSEYTDVTNNTYLEWTLNQNIKVIGRVGFTNTVSGTEVFLPGNHTRFNSFIGDNLFLKGTYDKGNGKSTMVSSDVNVNYSKVWGKHVLYTNVGANIREDNSENYLYSAIGFPNDKMDNIIFAKQYALNGKPSGTESINRELGGLAAANYSFDNRYFADLSVRTTASSQFGTNSRWGSFWSAGAGWNLHNEKFLQGNKTITHLKLRGSMGYTGSQNFNSDQALLLYNYFVDNSYQGMLGTYLNGLANEDLKWQQKLDYNAGLDAEIMSRLNLRVDVYNAITTNLLTDITTPPSLGFDSYKANLGQIRNTGIELKLNYRMLLNPAIRRSLNLFVTGISNTNKIVKISNSLQSITEEQDRLSTRSNKPLVRFQEGQSLDAIWAVPSMGIDPATGKEIFVKLDGTLTETWNANDKVVVGLNQPKVFGNMGANYEYKGFSIGFIAQYKVGGQIYNQTLVDKVENAQLNYNVDNRAYYDSWKKPGDNVLFKSIGVSNALTLATSRFVQDFNELNISSVNVGYDFYRFSFVKKLSLQRLQVMLNMNDVYRFSSVRAERGTAYPFARYGSFTVTANF